MFTDFSKTISGTPTQKNLITSTRPLRQKVHQLIYEFHFSVLRP